jgi:taurine transport system ATP-binding protein
LQDFARSAPYELSGGMRQRVNIARALATDPAILLMDEPFGALDSLTREQMQELLISIWEKTRKTIFLITHSIDEALSLATRIVVMSPRPGRIVARYEVDYVRRFSQGGDWGVIKTDPGFVSLREEIRALIHRSERADILRESVLAHE